MKKAIAFLLVFIFGCSIVLAASSRLYFHSIIYDEEVDQGSPNEFYITTEWDWEKSTGETVVIDDDCCGTTEIIEDTEPDYRNQKNLDDMQVTIFIPELGIVAYSLPYDLEKNDPTSNKIEVDLDDAKPGEYVARIIASNDYQSRVTHRIFVIE